MILYEYCIVGLISFISGKYMLWLASDSQLNSVARNDITDLMHFINSNWKGCLFAPLILFPREAMFKLSNLIEILGAKIQTKNNHWRKEW